MLRPENAERSQHRFPSAPESAVHQSVPERALYEQTENSWAPDSSASGVSPDLQDSLRNPGLSTAQDRDPDSNQNCPFEGSHHKPYSPPEPSLRYRPTFRWTEARSVPGVPSGQRSITRQKPRKYDMRTKVEAKLALYRHMLENADAYAKRLAHRLETRSLVIPAGKPGPSREDDRTSKSDDPSEGCDPGPALSKSADREHVASAHNKSPPHPILSWQLYATPPPGGDDLRTDLIALHMAYEAG